ncbi:glycosyltransferase family 39 protein [Streptomyces sp. SBR177]
MTARRRLQPAPTRPRPAGRRRWRASRVPLVPLVPLVWTVATGLWGLGREDSLWRDEAATWQVARRSTGDLLRMLEHVDVVHGLYYLLMHGLFAVFGPGLTVLRLPSVLATAVAAACVAAVGQRLGGARAGLCGGMAFGMLPAVQFYAQEGRPYALVAAGTGIATLLLVTALRDGPGRPSLWAGYGAALLVCGLLNWLSLMVLAAHLATLLRVRPGRALCARWAGAAGTATVGVLPLALYSGGQSDQVSWIPPLTAHMMIGPAVLLAIGALGTLLDRSARTGRLSVAAVGLPLLAVPQLGLIAVSLVQPLFLDRYVLFSLLGWALLAGAAVDAVAERAARTRFRRAAAALPYVVTGLAIAALLPQFLAKRSPASRVDDVLAAADEVRTLARPGDAVLFVPSARRDTRLVSPGAFAGIDDIALARTPEESATLKGEEADPERIRAAMLARPRILLVTDAGRPAGPPSSARDRMKTAVLARSFVPVEDHECRGRRVILYERRPGPR